MLKNTQNYLSRSLLLEKSNLGGKRISEEIIPAEKQHILIANNNF